MQRQQLDVLLFVGPQEQHRVTSTACAGGSPNADPTRTHQSHTRVNTPHDRSTQRCKCKDRAHRCTKKDGSFGGSYCTIQSTSGRSMPRAATSVHSSTPCGASLYDVYVAVRRLGSIFPCSANRFALVNCSSAASSERVNDGTAQDTARDAAGAYDLGERGDERLAVELHGSAGEEEHDDLAARVAVQDRQQLPGLCIVRHCHIEVHKGGWRGDCANSGCCCSRGCAVSAWRVCCCGGCVVSAYGPLHLHPNHDGVPHPSLREFLHFLRLSGREQTSAALRCGNEWLTSKRGQRAARNTPVSAAASKYLKLSLQIPYLAECQLRQGQAPPVSAIRTTSRTWERWR